MYIKIHIPRFTEKNNLTIQLVSVAEPEHLMPRYLKTLKIHGKWDSLFVILNSVFCLVSYFIKWG